MLNYDECKKIAEEKVKDYGVELNKSYMLNDDFVFDSDQELMGVLPIVVITRTGDIQGLWPYINERHVSMDSMIEM